MNRVFVSLVVVTFGVSGARAGEVVFDTPSDDRWHYPFNFNPGGRATASCFGSTADPNFTTFNDRDGIFLIAWRTDEDFCGGLPPGVYDIQSVRVTLTAAVCPVCPTAGWPVDLTPDPWFNMDYPITDADPGQPLELFGAGFGPEYTYANWVETSEYVGGDDQAFAPRDPFPFVFNGSAATKVHVEDSVKARFTPTPWAIGVPSGYTPGNQTAPFDVHFVMDLTLSGGRVRTYFQEQLAGGRVFVVVTALTVTFKQAPSGFPSFFTKEGADRDPSARAPILSITLAASGDADGDADRDLDDLPSLLDCTAGPGAAPAPEGTLTPAGCRCLFDFDEDGDVDLRDVDRFARRFTGGL